MTDTTQISDPFIWVKDYVLTNDFCQNTIEKFKTSDARAEGNTLGGVNNKAKRSTDLMITREPDWQDEDKILAEAVGRYSNEYVST